jgi:hypothetical protein
MTSDRELGTVGDPANAMTAMRCSPQDTTELALGGTKFTRPVSCIMAGFKLLPQMVGSHKVFVTWNIVCHVWKLVYCVSTRRGTGDYQRTCANSKRVKFLLADTGRSRGVSLKDSMLQNKDMVEAAPHCQLKLRSLVGTLPVLFKDAKDPESKGSFGDFETCQKLSQNGAKAGYKRLLRKRGDGTGSIKFTDRYVKMAAYERRTGHVRDKEWQKRKRALTSENYRAPTVTYSDIAPVTSCKTFDYFPKAKTTAAHPSGRISSYNIAAGGKVAHNIQSPIAVDRLKTGKPLTLHEAFHFNMDVPARCKTKEMLAKFAWRTWCMSCAAGDPPTGMLPIKNKKYTKFYPYEITGLKGLTEERLTNPKGGSATGLINTRSNYVDGDGMKRYMSLTRPTKPSKHFEALRVPPVLVTSLDKLPPALKEYNSQAGICSQHATTV